MAGGRPSIDPVGRRRCVSEDCSGARPKQLAGLTDRLCRIRLMAGDDTVDDRSQLPKAGPHRFRDWGQHRPRHRRLARTPTTQRHGQGVEDRTTAGSRAAGGPDGAPPERGHQCLQQHWVDRRVRDTSNNRQHAPGSYSRRLPADRTARPACRCCGDFPGSSPIIYKLLGPGAASRL